MRAPFGNMLIPAPTWGGILSFASSRTKSTPASCRALASVRPAIPPPAIITRRREDPGGLAILGFAWYEHELSLSKRTEARSELLYQTGHVNSLVTQPKLAAPCTRDADRLNDDDCEKINKYGQGTR